MTEDMPDTSDSGDRELMTRFRAGDREAFTVIYRMHSPAIFRFAQHMTSDRMKAADITQDVFVWLIHHPEDFDPTRGELGAFLIGVTRKFLLRQQRNERKFMPFSEAPGVIPISFAVEPSGSADLRRAIAALPARYREIVVLCDLEDNTYEAAAAALGCSIGTVRSRLHRARQLLARKLQTKRPQQRCSV
jgi:RNA polymerase sigma-70 factor, ECF subfamily